MFEIEYMSDDELSTHIKECRQALDKRIECEKSGHEWAKWRDVIYHREVVGGPFPYSEREVEETSIDVMRRRCQKCDKRECLRIEKQVLEIDPFEEGGTP